MTNMSINYFLNTPFLSEFNILNKNIVELTKNNNIIGGDTFGVGMNTPNFATIIVGIIIMIVGLMLLWFKNDLIVTEAIITSKFCYNDGCKLNLIYTVDSVRYSKILTVDKFHVNDTKIQIYYQKSNPNFIQLYKSNDYFIEILSLVIGLIFIFYSIYNNHKFNDIISSMSSTSSDI